MFSVYNQEKSRRRAELSARHPRFGANALGQQEDMWLAYARLNHTKARIHIFPER